VLAIRYVSGAFGTTGSICGGVAAAGNHNDAGRVERRLPLFEHMPYHAGAGHHVETTRVERRRAPINDMS